MKRQSLVSKICFYMFFVVVSCMNASNISFERISGKDLHNERQVFNTCWSAVYQDCSLQQLGLSDLALSLDEAFDQEEQDYSNQVENRLFFHVLKDNQVVGYISFEVQKEYAIYVRQYGLLPEFCTAEMFKDLIFVIFDHILNISCLHMSLHAQAIPFLQLSKEIGFVESARAESDRYIPLKMQFNRCGTCLCETDDEDDDEDFDIFDECDGDECGGNLFCRKLNTFMDDPDSVCFGSQEGDENE